MQITRRPLNEEETAWLMAQGCGPVEWASSLVPALVIGTITMLVGGVVLAGVFRTLGLLSPGLSILVIVGLFVGGTGVSLKYLMKLNERVHRAATLQYQADIDAGEIEDWRVRIRDAVEVEEFEDEGKQYYLELDDGRILFLMGQYLYDHDERFPNHEVLVKRLPQSGEVLNIECLGDPFQPSVVRPSFTEEEHRSEKVPGNGAVLEGPLSQFKR